jgi:hypothetical protein
MKTQKAGTAAQTVRNKLFWPTKTGHFLRQHSYKNPVQIQAGFDSRF